MKKIGIIGGSGLENPDILLHAKSIKVSTKYGEPSSDLLCGEIAGVSAVLISRHGRAHTITPTHVNNRANIQALKEQGCTHIVVTTACGSLREEIGRGDLVVLDQFIDFTRLRKLSFYDEFTNGEVRHTGMADPFDSHLRDVLIEAAGKLGVKCHKKGTVVTIEGPRFSTRAESNMFRAWGADVINMSVAPECILANEAGIPYAAVAMSTDYDCWKTDEEPVSWDDILEVFHMNVEKVIGLIISAIPKI